MSTSSKQQLRVGDWVRVRSAPEILATLDDHGALENVPFMEEMLPYLGRQFQVAQRAEKICDLVGPGGSRRMRGTVFLENLRCDGGGHGGCQAECRLYWKEAWLERVPAEEADRSAGVAAESESVSQLASRCRYGGRPAGWDGETESFRCQATEAFRATEPLRTRDPGQYLREVRSGNVGILRLIRVLARAFRWSAGRRLGIRPHLAVKRAVDAPEFPRLDLRPGEWVEVRSAEEIGATLDEKGLNRGLLFTPEMLGSTGRRARVRNRVETIVSERTGEMLHLKNDCIMLEDVVCTGERTPGMWFCHRDSYPFWREAWLKRVDAPSSRAS